MTQLNLLFAAAFSLALWVLYHLYWCFKAKTRVTDWDDVWHVNVTARLRKARRSLFMQRFDSLLAAWHLWLGGCLLLLLLATFLQPPGLPSDLPAEAWRHEPPAHLIWHKPALIQAPSVHDPPPVSTAGSSSLTSVANTTTNLLHSYTPSLAVHPRSLAALLIIDESEDQDADFFPIQVSSQTAKFPYLNSMQQNHLLYIKYVRNVHVGKAETARMLFQNIVRPRADTLVGSLDPVIICKFPLQKQLFPHKEQVPYNSPSPHLSSNTAELTMLRHLDEQPFSNPAAANLSVTYQTLSHAADQCFVPEKPLLATVITTSGMPLCFFASTLDSCACPTCAELVVEEQTCLCCMWLWLCSFNISIFAYWQCILLLSKGCFP